MTYTVVEIQDRVMRVARDLDDVLNTSGVTLDYLLSFSEQLDSYRTFLQGKIHSDARLFKQIDCLISYFKLFNEYKSMVQAASDVATIPGRLPLEYASLPPLMKSFLYQIVTEAKQRQHIELIQQQLDNIELELNNDSHGRFRISSLSSVQKRLNQCSESLKKYPGSDTIEPLYQINKLNRQIQMFSDYIAHLSVETSKLPQVLKKVFDGPNDLPKDGNQLPSTLQTLLIGALAEVKAKIEQQRKHRFNQSEQPKKKDASCQTELTISPSYTSRP